MHTARSLLNDWQSQEYGLLQLDGCKKMSAKRSRISR